MKDSICIHAKMKKCDNYRCGGFLIHERAPGCRKAESGDTCGHPTFSVAFCIPNNTTEEECKRLLVEATLRKKFIKGE